MPDLSFLKPLTDLQYLILVAGIVFLLLRVWGKKPKFLLSSLAPASSKDSDSEVSDAHECKKEGILEDILTKLKSIVEDVNTLKAETKMESRLNEERHELLQGQMTSLMGEFRNLYSILLEQKLNGK